MNIESICHSFSSNINSLLNQIIVSPTANSRRQGKKGLEYQTLEPRCLLSATAPEFASADMFVNEVHKPLRSDEVQGLVVDVNGRMLNLTQSDNVLQLVPGDHFSVADIAFHSSSKQGVFAAEGYVNKLADKQNASTTDYADGRFSLREDNQAATGSYGSIAGLNDGWTVEAGWDRLTVVLIHYTESNTDVFDRFVVDLRVDQPDLAFSTDVLDQISSQKVFVGDQVEIPGAWSNVGDGLYHNYAEVDIYHRSDMDRIVWAGALYGNVGDGTSVDGSFINGNTSRNGGGIFASVESAASLTISDTIITEKIFIRRAL